MSGDLMRGGLFTVVDEGGIYAVRGLQKCASGTCLVVVAGDELVPQPALSGADDDDGYRNWATIGVRSSSWMSLTFNNTAKRTPRP